VIRFIMVIVASITSLSMYVSSFTNIYGFFTVVINGTKFEDFSFGLWNTLFLPLIIWVLIIGTGLFQSSVLYPMFLLSLFMYWGTQISLFIVHGGFSEGSSLAQQAIFILLGLICFIITRWFVCHYFYHKYEETN
jgi:hypothetical protein